MRSVSALVLVSALWSMPAAAQAPVFTPSANPVSDSVREVLVRESKNLIGLRRTLPADKYGYQPTPAQLTFGQLIAHIVQTNMVICSAIGGQVTPDLMKMVQTVSGTDPKDALVGAIKQSFDFCTDALAKTSDAQLGEEVSMMGRATGRSRASAMVTIATDWADHYSTAASYLRLNGILPPSAAPPK